MTDIHSNDTLSIRSAPATLATVKHGGCVQLGDAITPAMVDAACNVLYAYWPSSRKDYRDNCRADARAALKAALAARQPVGDTPNFAACCAEGGGSISGCSCVNPNHVFLASQASLTAEERVHGETIDQRDRCEEVADELAGHIARITGVDIGEHSSANCPWQNAIEAAEEYKPAQAVDLTTVRYALDAAEGLAVACASVDGFSRKEIASAGREMRKQFADARALIDSPAVQS